jgi:hypothetical protein
MRALLFPELGQPSFIRSLNYLEVVESAWHDLTPLQQKERSRTMFTTVLIRGDRLVAGKPTDALFAPFRRLADFREPLGAHRISGSDGIVPSIRQ